jgi:hypothetical protein
MSRIEVHVERLLLDELAAADRAGVAAAFQRSLAARLAESLASGGRFTSFDRPVAVPAAIPSVAAGSAQSVGEALAGAVFERLIP